VTDVFTEPLQAKLPARLTPAQLDLIRWLLDLDQAHRFAGWAATGTDDGRKLAFLDQVARVHGQYSGGFGGFLAKTRELLG